MVLQRTSWPDATAGGSAEPAHPLKPLLPPSPARADHWSHGTTDKPDQSPKKTRPLQSDSWKCNTMWIIYCETRHPFQANGRGPVVVGIDGSELNSAAIEFRLGGPACETLGSRPFTPGT